MSYKIFTVPATRPGDDEAELNAFLGGRRVVKVDKQLIREGNVINPA